ncbi:MAG: hypothetical protein HKN60_07380 [Rhizobiales bacterium]|nr:hypothetical protein [Hyphomicrobiales bacterium]
MLAAGAEATAGRLADLRAARAARLDSALLRRGAATTRAGGVAAGLGSIFPENAWLATSKMRDEIEPPTGCCPLVDATAGGDCGALATTCRADSGRDRTGSGI